MPLTRARILAAAVLAVAVIATFAVARRSAGTYDVVAVFDQAHGLVKGGEVKVAGRQVGTISRIALGDDGYPHVRLAIEDGYRLRRGAVADARFASVSGSVNRYVALHQGRGPELRPGAVLGRATTDQPVEIDAVLGTLTPGTRADVRAVLEGLDASLSGRGPQIAATLKASTRALRETAGLAGELASDGTALRRFTEHGRRMVGVLAGERGALGATTRQLAAVLQTTAARQDDLSRAVGRLPAGLRSPRAALQRLDEQTPGLRTLVAATRPAARRLVPVSRELRPVLAAARPALAQAEGLAREAPGRLRQVRGLLPSARRLTGTLEPALAKANPMLDQARARQPDFFSFYSNWADFTSNYDANGNGARVALVLSPAPLNTIGPDDAGPGHLSAPFLRTPGVLENEPWRDYQRSFVGSGG